MAEVITEQPKAQETSEQETSEENDNESVAEDCCCAVGRNEDRCWLLRFIGWCCVGMAESMDSCCESCADCITACCETSDGPSEPDSGCFCCECDDD